MLFAEAADALEAAERERAQARRDALEEAARLADDPESCYACDIAAAIRRLAEKEKG